MVLIGIVVLAACGSGSSYGKPATAPNTKTGAGATVTTVPKAEPFTLDEGIEHDVCGIGISVKFIPATATSASADAPVLMGGPISNIDDQVQDHTADQPLPSNAAHAVVGSVATVFGQRFKVDAVDPANTRVRLEPFC